MKSIERLLCEAVHMNYPKYFANFPPNNPIRIGDFGYLKHDAFDYQGNVETTFQLKLGNIRKGSHANVEFKSKAGVSVRTTAEGKANQAASMQAKAEATVEFKKANSVFFIATGCQVKTIEDKISFGNQIIELFEKDQWKGAYVMVTSIVEARTLNLFISHADNASIKLNANASVPNGNLFEAGVNCSVVNENGIANKWVSEAHTVPLIGLSKISRALLFGKPALTTKYLVGGEDEQEDLDLLRHQVINSGKQIKEAFQFLPMGGDDMDQ